MGGGVERTQTTSRDTASRAAAVPTPSVALAASPLRRGCCNGARRSRRAPCADFSCALRGGRRGSLCGALRCAAASDAPPPLRWPGEAAVALRRLRDETECRGAAYRRALAAAPRHDADSLAAALLAQNSSADAAAELRGAVHRYALAADDLDRLCAAAECGFGDELVALAVTAPGPEVVSDAQLAQQAEHLWRGQPFIA